MAIFPHLPEAVPALSDESALASTPTNALFLQRFSGHNSGLKAHDRLNEAANSLLGTIRHSRGMRYPHAHIVSAVHAQYLNRSQELVDEGEGEAGRVPIAKSPAVANPDANLVRIARELRNDILAQVLLDTSKKPRAGGCNGNILLSQMPAIAYTSHRLYCEFVPTFLEKIPFIFNSSEHIDNFMSALALLPTSTNAWGLITKLHFNVAGITNQSLHLDTMWKLVRHTPSVGEVKLVFDFEQLMFPHGTPLFMSANELVAFASSTRTAYAIANDFELYRLFDIPQLKKVTMVCRYPEVRPEAYLPKANMGVQSMADPKGRSRSPIEHETFWDLVPLLADGFSEVEGVLQVCYGKEEKDDPREEAVFELLLERSE